MINTRGYHDFLAAQKSELAALQKQKQQVELSISTTKLHGEKLVQAKDIVNAVSVSTLNELRTFIEESVALCLQTVCGPEYQFSITYEVRRGRPEADISIVRNGKPRDPKCEMGCGVVDVASIGLRLVLWMLSVPRSSPTFVFDEPFRFVSADRTEMIGKVLQEICKTFGAQIIMVSHNEGLIDSASKVVSVMNNSGVSEVYTCLG